MLLTKKEILKHRPMLHKDVHCPGLGGDIRVKALTTSERDLFEQRYQSIKEVEPGVTPNIRAYFIVHHAVDDKGELMFTVDDVVELGKQSPSDLDRVFTACKDLSGFSDVDITDLEKK